MCGLAGILRVYPPGAVPPSHLESIPESWLDLLDNSIKHRGPDGQGRFRDRALRPDGSTVDVALIHRRLSILDHAGGAQPMISSSPPKGEVPSLRGGGGETFHTPALFQGSPTDPVRYVPLPDSTDNFLAVTFNGCIYNHRELRKELEAKGHKFTTDHSDTEVLLHGWREWRFDLLDRLEGMYAVAMWDRNEGKVALLRDRFGEKPLHTGFFENAGVRTQVWSSSNAGLVQSAIEIEARRVRANRDVLVGWIGYGWNFDAPESCSSSVLPGSGFLVERQSGFRIHSPRILHESTSAPIPSVRNVDSQLRIAVHTRLEADVPLGVFLSGGIDSALIAKYAAEKRPDLTAFTVRMPHPDYDESEAAALTAGTLGIQHEILECHTEAANDLVHAIEQLGLPFGDSSLLPSLWLCRAAKPHVSVALSGDGGDELFMGYERQRVAPLLALAHAINTDCLTPVAEALESSAPPQSRRSKLARLCRAAAGDGYGDLVAIFPSHLAQALMGDAAHSYYTPWGFSRCARPAMDDAARNFDTYSYLPFDLLRKSDTASMAVALEVRSPMLDSTLASLALNASRQSLMPRGQRKGLLRAVARKYLPKEIVDRPKMGFAIPVGDWFRSDFGQMKTLLLDTLHSADPFPADLLGLELNRRFIDQMLAEHMESRRDHSQRLYMLLVLGIWCRWLRGVQNASPARQP